MIGHKKVSGKADSPIPGLVQPSDWDAEHEVTGLLGALLALAATPMRVPYINAEGQGADFAISTTAIGLLALSTVELFRNAILAAPLDGADLTGNVRAPTPASNDNSRRLATTEFVVAKINALVGGAPGQLDALNELAAAIDNDPNFAATMATALGNRLRVDTAQGLSTLQKAQACANLGLAVVATSGGYADLSGRPTLGTAAALDYGTGANQLVRLDASARLPGVDGSQLNNVTPTNSVRFDVGQNLPIADKRRARNNIAVNLRNHIIGLICSNNAGDVVNDITITAGEAGSDSSPSDLIVLPSPLVKQLDAVWAPGNNAGGRSAGDTLSNKTYHVWLIGRSDTGDADVIFDPSATAPTMPSASWDMKRHIWSVVRVSNAIVLFAQVGDDALLQVPFIEINDSPPSPPSTSTQIKTLSRVPTGIKVKAELAAWYASTSATQSGQVLITAVSEQQDTAATGSIFTLAGLIQGNAFSASGLIKVYTNTSAQIRTNANYTDAGTLLRVTLLGYTHPRGRI